MNRRDFTLGSASRVAAAAFDDEARALEFVTSGSRDQRYGGERR